MAVFGVGMHVHRPWTGRARRKTDEHVDGSRLFLTCVLCEQQVV